VKTLFKIILVLFVFSICAVAGAFLAGVVAALAAVLLHAAPYAVTMIVRVLSTLFFFGFILLAWVIYSSLQARKLRRRKNTA
jgi:hypothetical protein